MRIALFIERFDPSGGGVEAAAWQVAHGLAAAGDEVHVFARRGRPGSGPRLHEVRVGGGWQPARVLAFSRATARAAPRASWDVVHSFSRTRHQDVYRAGGGSHADYIERTYGAPGGRARRLSPRHAVLLALERAVFRDATQIVQCNSELVREQIEARYGVPDRRLVVIPNGVDLVRFDPQRRTTWRERVRRAEGHGGGEVWLLVGSGFHRKGVDIALRALAASSARSAELWIAGRDRPAPWRRLASKLGVDGRVRFLGARGDLERVYAAADALLLPTRYDACANACLEAAAAGLPVVTSAANGAARWLGDVGLVVDDAEDVGGFAKALDALSEPGTRARLGAAARRRAEGQSWRGHVAALRSLYGQLLR